jgi:hypothetical protein
MVADTNGGYGARAPPLNSLLYELIHPLFVLYASVFMRKKHGRLFGWSFSFEQVFFAANLYVVHAVYRPTVDVDVQMLTIVRTEILRKMFML